MSSILITHPILSGQKVCQKKLVLPWCRVIFQKSIVSCFSEIVETKKSGMHGLTLTIPDFFLFTMLILAIVILIYKFTWLSD